MDNHIRMKTCSKCRRVLELVCFVKSPRYSDGLYPSCKECRKKVFLNLVAKNIVCCRCRKRPHQPNHVHCYECQRELKGESKVPRYRRDSSNKLYCCKCKQLPRTAYGGYCLGCALKANEAWRKKQRPSQTRPEKKRKASARHYVNQLFKRGKLRRHPCEHCGAPSVHFHHLDYKDRTTNIQHVCLACHVRLEREKRKLLTGSKS